MDASQELLQTLYIDAKLCSITINGKTHIVSSPDLYAARNSYLNGVVNINAVTIYLEAVSRIRSNGKVTYEANIDLWELGSAPVYYKKSAQQKGKTEVYSRKDLQSAIP